MRWKRKRSDEDFAEEIRSHLQLEADELSGEGVPDSDSAARRAFGNIAAAKERFYERRRILWLDDLTRDVRYALRTMRRSPGFTLGTALLLALGIGANTAVYSFVEAVLLRSLPVEDAGSLVVLKWKAKSNPPVKRSINGEARTVPSLGYTSGNFPFRAFEHLQSGNQVLSSVIGFFGARMTVFAGGSAEMSSLLFVSGNFFSGLNLAPSAGRLLDPQDDRAEAPAAAVISHDYWKARFAGSESAIGQTLQINNQPFQVVGVAPSGFFGVDIGGDKQIYVPIRFYQSARAQFVGNANSMYEDDHWYWTMMMGRLKRGVSKQQAEAALATAFSSWVTGTAATEKERANLPALYLQDGSSGIDFVRFYFSKPIYLLAAMAALILAIACANIANLLLARAASRRREMAVRIGLGAGGWRVARLLLTESVVLSILGGALGVLFAWGGMHSLSAMVAAWQPDPIFRVEMNWTVLAVCSGLAILTGILFGLAPAIQASRVQPAPALKEQRLGSPMGRLARLFRGGGLKNGLVAVQIAISLLLLAGASLFIRSMSNLQAVKLGFNHQNVLLVDLDARQAGYRNEALDRYYADVTGRLKEMPGVQSASLSSYALVAGSRSGTSVSFTDNPTAAQVSTAVMWVGPDFFGTMQIPLVLGRDISARDVSSAAMVVVVNEAFANKHWPGRNPLGETVRFGKPEDTTAVVVGVTKDTPLYSLREKVEPVVYGAFSQHLTRISTMTVAIRTAGHPSPIEAAVRKIIASIDPRIPTVNVRTQAKQIEQTIGQERLLTFLCGTFAILALVIACVGLYGTLAYGVSRRIGEIGVRMALGAHRRQVIAMILRESVPVVVTGVIAGLSVTWMSTRVLESYLFGLTAEPAEALPAVITLLACALIAGFLPAWRASRIDPMDALRHE